jgi:hypothetical protein
MSLEQRIHEIELALEKGSHEKRINNIERALSEI